MRYGLIAGGALLLLLALLGGAIAPGDDEGRRAAEEARAASAGTGPRVSVQGVAARGSAALSGRAVQRTATVGTGPETQVDVPSQPESVLTGRILGPEGLGLEGARIALMGASLRGAVEVRTGADGRFEVSALTEDTYDVRVERPGFLSVMREIRLPQTEPLELTLYPSAAVVVKVYGARGEPVEEASVSLTLVGEGRGETVREEGTDAQGSVHFGGLVPGSYIAQVRVPGYLTSAPVPVEAWDEEAVPVTVRLREGLTLSGRVRDARGVPVAEAEVGVLEEGTSVSSARTDAQGRFTLSGLVPGRLLLRVEKFGHPTRDAEVEVPSTHVELMLEGPVPGD